MTGTNDFDVVRLLEKRFVDIRHVEAERHWFLLAFFVFIAGVLTFLAQHDERHNLLFAYGILWLISILGLLHAWRFAHVLQEIQSDIGEMGNEWSRATTDLTDISTWRRR